MTGLCNTIVGKLVLNYFVLNYQLLKNKSKKKLKVTKIMIRFREVFLPRKI